MGGAKSARGLKGHSERVIFLESAETQNPSEEAVGQHRGREEQARHPSASPPPALPSPASACRWPAGPCCAGLQRDLRWNIPWVILPGSGQGRERCRRTEGRGGQWRGSSTQEGESLLGAEGGPGDKEADGQAVFLPSVSRECELQGSNYNISRNLILD